MSWWTAGVAAGGAAAVGGAAGGAATVGGAVGGTGSAAPFAK